MMHSTEISQLEPALDFSSVLCSPPESPNPKKKSFWRFLSLFQKVWPHGLFSLF